MAAETARVRIMNEPTCADCRFFLALDATGDNGVCRGSTPTAILMGMRQGIGRPEPVIQSFFAPMMSGGWCGKHEHKITLSKIDMSKFRDVPAEGSA